ncbi:hypothetical protein K432DRAFT_347804 [Lepidopterella palustris CBS 459.81]|uniref:Nitrogen permease regulator 3 n=1 Tax=Lepidopterella palustris CBS 459.81 TaxID=1314670 RepID=A0A8E2EFX4_9PEZI|nr:hypothetical protein K432DRAFT_347804 [Lepidopterella palustris CBS 459.81]
MSPPLPPSSTLHSILLVTESRSLGPRLVFHYPPSSPSVALLAANTAPAWYGPSTSTGTDTQSSSSDWGSSTEDEGAGDDEEAGSKHSGRSGRVSAYGGGSVASYRDREKARAGGGGGAWGRGPDNVDEDDSGGAEENPNGRGSKKASGGTGNNKNGGGRPEWETVLGFKVDALEKMLCPGKSFNKKRFELGVEGIVFVGAPMFVRDDGGWKKGRRWEMEREKTTKEEAHYEAKMLAKLKNSVPKEATDKAVDVEEPEEEKFIYPEGFEPGYGHGLMSGAASGAVSDAGSDTRSASTNGTGPDMTMFNVVFVLNPPALEYQLRVKEMYDNVARKYAKALKYEQARFNYVWKESKRILALKNKAKENRDSISIAWQEIMSSSPLAKSIAIIYDSISNDKIAHVHLDATFDTSFQIPQAISTPYIPTVMEPQMPGLWLTTANIVDDDEADTNFTQNSALLLLEDIETLVKDLEADAKDNATALAFYIRNVTPTKSLQKLSVMHSIPAQDIEYIAGHLVYWRRARLIPPLHPRDTYIVSPNADMRALVDAIPVYAARFPTLPSLPEMLNMLSGTPRPYGTWIPSSAHRQAYMEILAWLMRGGWVTQLRTFAWVRVTADIKSEVAAIMERENAMKKSAEQDATTRHGDDMESAVGSLLSGGDIGDGKRSSFLSPSTPARRPPTNDDTESMGTSAILSPRLAPYSSPARPSSDAGSISSGRTAVPQTYTAGFASSPQSQTHQHRPLSLHLKKPTNTTSPSSNRVISPVAVGPFSPSQATSMEVLPPYQSSFKPSLILSPRKANAIEARWLERIGASFSDPDLRELWPMLLRYFDGKHALDDISVRECIKRKRVAALIGKIREGGWLLTVRHW